MQQLPSPTLPELILQTRNGNQEAFEILLERYSPLIRSMTSQYCAQLSEQDKEDLYQEALLAFYRAARSYRLEQTQVQFGLYAKECIRNRLISHLRKLKKQEQFLSAEADEISELPSEQTDPVKLFLEEEAYILLYRKIKEVLSEYENRVWWMYLSGRTAKEIAAAFQTEEKSVQNALYRIRRKLRSIIPAP